MRPRASCALALVLLLQAQTAAGDAARACVIRGVRIFDGSRVLEGTVVVENGTIAAMGKRPKVPAGAEVVDGTGMTLLPGLIDAHTHVFGDALRKAVVHGVTTELDMFTAHFLAAMMRSEQAAGGASGRADLFSAGTLVTVPGGHGTEYGMAIPTLEGPEAAPAFVDARLAEGSDYIKIVYDDGSAYGKSTPTLSKETMAAVIAAAHARGKLAVVHIGTLKDAGEAIESGADGIVHLFLDRPPDASFGKLVARHRAFVIPTLTVLESVTGVAGGASLSADAAMAKALYPVEVDYLSKPFRTRPGSTLAFAHAQATVRQLRAANVPVLAGTDAPNPGTVHGASLHRELELLVTAGLTPLEALAAATSVPAARFKLADRGRIAPGMRADLLLVQGDPTSDIRATRKIVRVWKGGVPIDRASYLEDVRREREAAR